MRDEAAGLFRREPSQPARLPDRYRIRRTILRLPRISRPIATTSLHRTSPHRSPHRPVVPSRSLALLIRNRLPRLNLHLKSAKWMAVRTTPKCPRRNPTASLLPGRDSSTQHSASNILDSDNQCRPSHTRRHGQHPDPTLLVSCCRLVSDRSLAHNRLGSNLASS